jgi:hypothetical protein
VAANNSGEKYWKRCPLYSLLTPLSPPASRPRARSASPAPKRSRRPGASGCHGQAPAPAPAQAPPGRPAAFSRRPAAAPSSTQGDAGAVRLWSQPRARVGEAVESERRRGLQSRAFSRPPGRPQGWPPPPPPKLQQPEIHRVDPESGSTLTLFIGIFSQTAGSTCEFWVNPVNFTLAAAATPRRAPRRNAPWPM